MNRKERHLSFWIALAVALGGATFTHQSMLPAPVSLIFWQETLRPLLIAGSLTAWTLAAAQLYGGAFDLYPENSRARYERPALWTVALLSLISLLLPTL